jgi:DNA-binding MarR family transcriptional regulator
MTFLDQIRLDAILVRAREHGLGALMHPMLLIGMGLAKPSELAKRTGVSAARMTATGDALVERGWAERYSDPKDRRMQKLRLTGKGREVAEKVFGKLE